MINRAAVRRGAGYTILGIWLIAGLAVLFSPKPVYDTTEIPAEAPWVWQVKDASGTIKGHMVAAMPLSIGYEEHKKLQQFFGTYVQHANAIVLEVEHEILANLCAVGVEKAIIDNAYGAFKQPALKNLETAAFQRSLLNAIAWGSEPVKMPWNSRALLSAAPGLMRFINSIVDIIWGIPAGIVYSLYSLAGFNREALETHARETGKAWEEIYFKYLKGTMCYNLWYKHFVFPRNAENISLFAQRHAAWAEILDTAFTKNNTTLAAFGTAHFFGKSGIIPLLQAKGWIIEPVAVNPFAQ